MEYDMHSSITQKEKINPFIYPVLKRYNHRDTDFIVLFVSKQTGVVVHTDNVSWKLGHYSDGWSEEKFEVFEGTITLSN
jgi:hypothetical protein